MTHTADMTGVALGDGLGFRDGRHNPNRPPWSAEQLRTLRQHVDTHTAAQIGAMIGRTANAVKHKASERGLSLRKVGERCSWSKYLDAACERARSLHEQGFKISAIQEEVQIPFHALHSILYFKRVG